MRKQWSSCRPNLVFTYGRSTTGSTTTERDKKLVEFIFFYFQENETVVQFDNDMIEIQASMREGKFPAVIESFVTDKTGDWQKVRISQ